MRSAENIEKLIKNLNIDTNTKIDEEFLGEVVEAFEESKNKKSTAAKQNIWRIFMKSRITKLAAAAVIVVVAYVVIHLSGGSIDVATVSFAQMTEAMKKMPWLHAVIEGTYSGKQDRLEGWISFESRIHASKRPSGEIQYRHGNILNEYDPKTETITIFFMPNDEIEKFGSVWGFWETIIKQLSEAKAEVSQEKSRYGGKETRVFKIGSSPFGTPMEIKLTVDAEKNLPIFLNQKAFGTNGDITIEANAYFDYPENGPSDIYDLGVPRSAKVINNLPSKDVPQILEMYSSYRESAPAKYIALVTNSWFDEKLDTFLTYGISVIHRNNKIQRIDDFRLPRTKHKEWRETLLKFKKEMGSTFGSQLTWWKENGEMCEVELYDGKFQYNVSRENNKWVAQPRKYIPWGDSRADNDLADIGWGVNFLSPRQSTSPFTVIENSYSKKHNLICLESKCQCTTTDTGWAILPQRIVCFLNPQRDFICQRFEKHEVLDAPWQKDKSWLQTVDPNKISAEEIVIREVTEFGQTNKGQWYPKVIEKEHKRGANDRRKVSRQMVFLKTDVEFPDGIFDPKNLPKAND